LKYIIILLYEIVNKLAYLLTLYLYAFAYY